MRTFAIVPFVLATACATTSQNAPGASAPDPGSVKASLEAYMNEANSHMAQGDFAFLKASACPDSVVAWDTDENGAPVVADGKAAVDAMLDKYTAIAHTPGMQMTTSIASVRCEAFGDAGYCLEELDQTMTQNGVTMGPFKIRGTLIAKMFHGRWIWTHWHASLREAAPPAPPAMPASIAAPAPAPAAAPAAAAPTPAAAPAPAAATTKKK